MTTEEITNKKDNIWFYENSSTINQYTSNLPTIGLEFILNQNSNDIELNFDKGFAATCFERIIQEKNLRTT